MNKPEVTHISDTLTKIELKDRVITLIGTAHISPESIEEVNNSIIELKPDHLCIEIDEGRVQTLDKKSSWHTMDLNKVFKERKAFLLLSNLVLSSFQKKMGGQVGTKPGDEMKKALELAKEYKIEYSLSDRPVQITLQRAWAKCNLWNKSKLLASLISSAFADEEISEEELEELKKKHAVQNMMNEMADYLPSVKEVLIDERDQYLATNIFKAKGSNIVAVIGAGHTDGIIEWIEKLNADENSSDMATISEIPKKGLGSKLIGWSIPLLFLALTAVTIVIGGKEKGFDLLQTWFWVNSIPAAIGAIIALARPQTILTAFFVAPFSSLVAFFGVGMATGPLEYFSRKPKVSDFETLNDDSITLRGWYKNRVTRILLVFLLTSLGSFLGTIAGFSTIFGQFGNYIIEFIRQIIS